MKTIFKYEIHSHFSSQTSLSLPVDAEVLDCQFDEDGFLRVWVALDTEADLISRTFTVIGTGYYVPEGARHISTLQDKDKWGINLVYHIFEVNNEDYL